MLGAESRDSGTAWTGTYGAELGQVPGRQDRRVTLLSGPSRQGTEVPTLQARRLGLSGGAATFPRPHSRTTGSHRGQEKKRSTRQRKTHSQVRGGKTHGQAVRQTKGPSSPRLSELLTSRHLCLGQAPPPSFLGAEGRPPSFLLLPLSLPKSLGLSPSRLAKGGRRNRDSFFSLTKPGFHTKFYFGVRIEI